MDSKELEKAAAEFDKWWAERKRQQKERDKDLPRCDCGIGDEDEACYYACVGV